MTIDFRLDLGSESGANPSALSRRNEALGHCMSIPTELCALTEDWFIFPGDGWRGGERGGRQKLRHAIGRLEPRKAYMKGSFRVSFHVSVFLLLKNSKPSIPLSYTNFLPSHSSENLRHREFVFWKCTGHLPFVALLCRKQLFPIPIHLRVRTSPTEFDRCDEF